MPKEEVSSPTVATESLLLSGVIDAKENHNTITLDTLNAFVQRGMPESINHKQVILKIHWALVGMLCEIVLEVYEDFLTYDNNNNKIFCVNILKLHYRMLKESIDYYQKFAGDMSEIRHELNPNTPCVVNKTINTKKQTLL